MKLPKKPKQQAGLPGAQPPIRQVPLAEIKDDLSRYLRLAQTEEIVITRHGTPAGVLIGFETQEDWFDYRLEHHSEFLRRVAQARDEIRAGRGVRLEDLLS
jgi:prevent-host-death family protein